MHLLISHPLLMCSLCPLYLLYLPQVGHLNFSFSNYPSRLSITFTWVSQQELLHSPQYLLLQDSQWTGSIKMLEQVWQTSDGSASSVRSFGSKYSACLVLFYKFGDFFWDFFRFEPTWELSVEEVTSVLVGEVPLSVGSRSWPIYWSNSVCSNTDSKFSRSISTSS